MRDNCTKLSRNQYWAIGEEIAQLIVLERKTREEIINDIGISVYQYHKCIRVRYGGEIAVKLSRISRENYLRRKKED